MYIRPIHSTHQTEWDSLRDDMALKRARLKRLRVLVDSGAEIDRRHKALCRDLALCNSDTRAGDALMCAAHIVYLRCRGTETSSSFASIMADIVIFIFISTA